jgi:acyl-CoA synthetase (AMP-forming)/AMP-acid ligase II
VKSQVAGYKVPSCWLLLAEDELPLLASRKPDKRALAAMARRARPNT